jgi:hypothetical protein
MWAMASLPKIVKVGEASLAKRATGGGEPGEAGDGREASLAAQ